MGIFTNSDRANIGSVDYAELIPANESYGCALGAAQALIDVYNNDMALFEAAIASDFSEVAAVNEGATIVAVNEGAKEILTKVIEMFKKLLAKIKGIFEAFIAKLSSHCKDNKKLYDKYKNKITGANGWKDFKVKVRKPKINNDIRSAIDSAFSYKITEGERGLTTYNITGILIMGLEFDKLEKSDGYDSEEIKEKIMKERLDKSVSGKIDGDMKNMEEEYMDLLFNEEELEDEWSLGDITGLWVGGLLADGNKWETAVKKANDKLTRCISKIINELDKIKTETSKKYLDKDSYSQTEKHNRDGITVNSDLSITRKKSASDYKNTGTSYETELKRYSALQRVASNEQEVITKFTNTYMNVVKFTLAQARKVWTSAAAYVSTHNEGAEFYQAVGETYAYDFISDMEAVG
jgi:hypothetical protein